MKGSFLGLLLMLAMIAASRLSAQTSLLDLTFEQIERQLLEQPPQAIVAMSQKFAVNDVPAPIVASYSYADLDSGKGYEFNFLVAFYHIVTYDATPQATGGFLRVFQFRDDRLVLAGDQDTPRKVGGFSTEWNLVDVNGDGIPEIEVDSTSVNGQDHSLSLFMWTGSSLHDLIGGSVQAFGFADLDHDGTLEILTARAGGSGIDALKLFGQNYRFFKSFSEDTGDWAAPDDNIVPVRPQCKAVEPDRFSLDEIQRSKNDRSQNNDDTVLFILDNLKQVNGYWITADQVDLASIVVSPHLTPLRMSVQHRNPNNDDDNHDKDSSSTCREMSWLGSVAVWVSRRDFLRSLQQLQPEGPLQAGDQLQVILNAFLRDGRQVSAAFTVSIVDNP